MASFLCAIVINAQLSTNENPLLYNSMCIVFLVFLLTDYLPGSDEKCMVC